MRDTFAVMYPDVFTSSFCSVSPKGEIIADIPVFPARSRYLPFSTARIRAWARCWSSAGVFPNQLSLLAMASICAPALTVFLTIYGNTDS